MDVLRIAGDALWILALSLMATASRAAWRRIAPGASTPVLTSRSGRVLWRAPRDLALCITPGIAFVVGIALLLAAGRASGWSDAAIIAFGLRATLAPLFAVAHLTWLDRAMAVMAREGALKP